MMTPNIILFDIDNTLADCDHRLHYVQREEVNWREFEQQCVYDTPIVPTILAAQAYKAMGKQVWCWSGRSTDIQRETEIWLRVNNVPFDQLLLRPPEVAKAEPTEYTKLRWLLDAPIPRERVICAYDDDANVVKVLREKGKLQVFQVRRPK